jgi:glycosyltransferase involved in cell wall biosynthesis
MKGKILGSSGQPLRKPSVAIIGTRGYPSYYGGFETAVRKLAPYLAEKGWDVTVYGRPGATKPDDLALDPRVHRKITRGVESKSLSTLTYGLTSCVDAAIVKPDVALVMNVANGYWLPILKLRGIPTLVNVDGIEWDRAKWGRLAKAVFHNGARWTARFGTRLVFDARAIAARWKTEFAREGDFIPYGGDFPDDTPVVPGFQHRGYVLVVARFVPENTIVEFLHAAEVLSQDWPVVIVGTSGYGGELDEQARDLDARSANVHWLGHVSDDQKLLSLWQHAGAYFHGHSVGGTNPALVQAMAAGAPIVARDTVYNREVLENTAALVEPTVGGIVDGVSALMRDRTRADAESIRNVERARDYYSWIAVCEAYEESLVRVLRRSTRR